MRFVKLLLTASCDVTMFLAVGCRPAPAVLPLQDPPAKVQQSEARDFYYEAGHMTADEAATLEAQLKNNPEDFDARRKLLVFYGPDFTGNVAARRPHILWLIEHHPDHPIAGSWEARIFPKAPDPVPDAGGYATAKKLWLKHAANPNARVAVLSNAAVFLEVADKPLAEELLLRGQAKAPVVCRKLNVPAFPSAATLRFSGIASKWLAIAERAMALAVAREFGLLRPLHWCPLRADVRGRTS